MMLLISYAKSVPFFIQLAIVLQVRVCTLLGKAHMVPGKQSIQASLATADRMLARKASLMLARVRAQKQSRANGRTGNLARPMPRILVACSYEAAWRDRGDG